MFFISSCKDGKYGVTDTSDFVEEYYTTTELKQIVQTTRIVGTYLSAEGRFGILFPDKLLTSKRSEMANLSNVQRLKLAVQRMPRDALGDVSEVRVTDNAIQTRWAGGKRNWGRSDGHCEDICDADEYNAEASKCIKGAIDLIRAGYGLSLDFVNHHEKGFGSYVVESFTPYAGEVLQGHDINIIREALNKTKHIDDNLIRALEVKANASTIVEKWRKFIREGYTAHEDKKYALLAYILVCEKSK